MVCRFVYSSQTWNIMEHYPRLADVAAKLPLPPAPSSSFRARPTSIIQRLSEPQEVAAMVAYACSDLASSTTGATLRVEGGIVTGMG